MEESHLQTNSNENTKLTQELSRERAETLLRQVNNIQTKEQANKDSLKAGVPYSKLIGEADKSEKCLLIFGYILAILAGAALPSFVFFIGYILDAFNPTTS